MDFLEIRRKAKERAAARAAAAQAPASPAPAPPGGEAGARRPLALDPLPLPPPEPVAAPPAFAPEPPAAHPPVAGPVPPPPATPVHAEAVAPTEAPAAPGPDAERQAAESAAEAARVEAELDARLREMPAAGDGRFLTWRPSSGAVPDVASVAPQAAGGDAAARGEARRRGEGGRRLGAAPGAAPDGHHAPLERPADPLDDFFFRADESGPDLGALEASAEAPASPAEVVERVEYLTFLLGAEEYGVEIGRVREVMRSPPITEVPRAPADVLGVITVRGEVVAVFDPRGRLGLPRGGSAEGGRVIIVDDGAGACGLLVDGVTSVVRLPRGSIEACPQGIGGASAECLEGIGRDQERLFTVLSVPALLKPARRAEGRG